MKIIAMFALVVCSTVVDARPPTTRLREIAPRDVPVIVPLGQVIDTRLPAFVPMFARVNNPAAGQAVRDDARINTLPPPIYGSTYFGYGYGSLVSHAFIR